MYMYLDLHASERTSKNIIIGNFITYQPKLAKSMLFPRLLTMNSLHFDLKNSNFNPTNFIMVRGDDK